MTPSAQVRVTAVKHRIDVAQVYNLTVADLHTYYVVAGDTPVLVHNCGPDLDELSSAGLAPDKNGMTGEGRAYQKHAARGQLPMVGGKEFNSAGRELHEDILTDPNSDIQSITRGTLRGGVRVVSNRVMNGKFVGAVYNAQGGLEYFGLYG
jgi:hypothetical protein